MTAGRDPDPFDPRAFPARRRVGGGAPPWSAAAHGASRQNGEADAGQARYRGPVRCRRGGRGRGMFKNASAVRDFASARRQLRVFVWASVHLFRDLDPREDIFAASTPIASNCLKQIS